MVLGMVLVLAASRQGRYSILIKRNILILATRHPGYAGAASPRRELPDLSADGRKTMPIRRGESRKICMLINGWSEGGTK